MTREQIQELLATMQVAFPNFNPKDKKATINLWFMMLSDYTYEQVSSALKEYILTEKTGFAPSIGQIANLVKAQKERKYFEELERMLLSDTYMNLETAKGEGKALEIKHEGALPPEGMIEDIRKRLECNQE